MLAPRSLAFLGAAALALAACATPTNGGELTQASQQLAARIGAELGPGDATWPAGVVLTDGVSEDEAVAVALWRSPELGEALSALGFARAALTAAEVVANPVLSLLFPLGPKQFEFALKWPVDFLWQRPKRIAAAEFDAERAGELLVQGGLDLARDVRVACADLRRAHCAASELAALADLQQTRSDLEHKRTAAGDTSAHAAAAALAQAQRARAQAEQAAIEAQLAAARLAALLGCVESAPLQFGVDAERADVATPAVAELVRMALAARPDLRAAELAIAAAGARVGLAEREAWSLTAVLDAVPRDSGSGLQLGPGIDVPLPLFDRNQAGKARADVELERAARHYVVVRQAIVRDVQLAHAEWTAARQACAAFERDVLPNLTTAARAADAAHQAGAISRFEAIDAAQAVHRARGELAQFAYLRARARAQLERNVGSVIQ